MERNLLFAVYPFELIKVSFFLVIIIIIIILPRACITPSLLLKI